MIEVPEVVAMLALPETREEIVAEVAIEEPVIEVQEVVAAEAPKESKKAKKAREAREAKAAAKLAETSVA